MDWAESWPYNSISFMLNKNQLGLISQINLQFSNLFAPFRDNVFFVFIYQKYKVMELQSHNRVMSITSIHFPIIILVNELMNNSIEIQLLITPVNRHLLNSR